MNEKAVALVEEHLRAEDRRDVAAVLSTFSEDCIYRIPAYQIDLRGKQQIGAYYAAMFEAFPDFVNVSEVMHVAERAIFVEVVTERTHLGEWGSLPATGRSFRTRSLAQFPIAGDGLLGGEIVHVNPADALHKIGALPSGDPFDAARRLRGPLADRVALVTGASRGIGRAVAVALARAGAHLMLAGRDVGALQAVREQVQTPITIAGTVSADLTDVAECRRVVEQTRDRFGSIDVLVNGAGGTVRGPALDMTDADWDRVQQLNLKAVFFTCQAAARVMASQPGGGVIVNIASLNSAVGNAWAASYAASKGGIAQLTKSLALEWADDGIRVNAIGPGFIETEMTAPLLADPQRSARILSHIPMKRFGRPDELAGAAVLLASDASAYMTGQIVYVDGGYLSV